MSGLLMRRRLYCAGGGIVLRAPQMMNPPVRKLPSRGSLARVFECGLAFCRGQLGKLRRANCPVVAARCEIMAAKEKAGALLHTQTGSVYLLLYAFLRGTARALCTTPFGSNLLRRA